MQKVFIFLFLISFLGCRQKVEHRNIHTEKKEQPQPIQSVAPEKKYFIQNEKFALDTLKAYEQYNSVFKEVGEDYFIYVNQKTSPKLAIIGDREGKKFFFCKKEKWNLFLVDTTYLAIPRHIYFKDLNGDYLKDIYLADFQGSGNFPYSFVLLQKTNNKFEYADMYWELGHMNFDYPTKLLQTQYYGRKDMSKSRYRYVKDTMELVDVVYFEGNIIHTTDTCVTTHYRYKKGEEIIVKQVKGSYKKCLKYYNSCLWKTNDER